MTKKDFILIAKVLKELGEEAAYCFDSGHDRYAIAQRFAEALASTNKDFDAGRFIDASTLSDDRADFDEENAQ
jgi:hypothetical protein